MLLRCDRRALRSIQKVFKIGGKRFATNCAMIATLADQINNRKAQKMERAEIKKLMHDKLCRLVTLDQLGMNLIGTMSLSTNQAKNEEMIRECRSAMSKSHDEDFKIDDYAIDDVNGGELIPNKVREARREEISYIRKMCERS